jgi:hypothetical protein
LAYNFASEIIPFIRADAYSIKMKTQKQTANNSLMSDITVVEFETSQHGGVYLSELSEGPPYTVHGVALGAGDVTVGQSGIKKKWPATELEDAADSLRGTNLVEDHNNDASGVVGRVTKSGYKEGSGVVYEAELYDEDLAEKVRNGLLEVSIRGYHADVDALEEDEETGAKVVEDIKFDNLSIVPTGAAPSNTLEMGEHAELSAAELSAFTETLEVAELQEIEPGMWVQWDGGQGITISQVQDGQIEVDIYEESGGKFRSTGETEMMDTGSLEEWDVDEDEDIGTPEEEDDSEDDESGEENMPLIKTGMKFFDSVNNSTMVIESVDGNMATVTTEDEKQNDSWKEEIENIIQKLGEGEWEHAGHIEQMGRSNAEQYTDFSKDDWVQWYPSETTEAHGKVTSVNTNEETVTVQKWVQDSDGKWKKGSNTVTKNFDDAIEPWGNFPREQDDFSDAIEDGDPRRKEADTDYEENSIARLLSDQTEKALENKVEEHNDEHGDENGKKVTKTMLKKVYDRGAGAYNDSHREGMTQNQWAMARVNAFLYLVRNGNPENDNYTQDNDLLPDGHSKKSSSSEENAITNEAEKLRYMKDYSGEIQAPMWKDGQMVKWQVNPAMKGKVVHVDREKKVLMVEVMENTEQGLQPTGFTLTAGYQDVVPMDAESAAVTTRDMPTQDSQPTHETDSVNNLLKKFIEESGSSEPSLADFIDWMSEENLAIERGEGEEEVLDSQKKRQNSHEGEPHRYIDAEDEQSAELAERYDDYPEAASKNAQMALDAKEETDNPNDCGTDVGWKRARQLAEGGGISRAEVGKMSAFNRHRQNSEMDSDEGRADCGWMMWKAWGGDEGVDWAKKKLDSIEEENAMADVPDDHMFKNREDAMEKADDLGLDGVHEMDGRWMPGETHEEYMDAVASTSKYGDDEMDEDDEEASVDEGDTASDAEELQDYEMHTPDWSGTTEDDWSSPDLEDFDTDDPGEVANHFLISSSGFPPENFTDLKLPVVEPNGDLSRNALVAVKGGRGASAVDGLSDEMESEIIEWVNKTANEEFDENWGEEEEENAQAKAHDSDTAGRPTPGENTVGGVRVLSGDDLQHKRGKSGESDADSLTNYKVINMTENIEEKLSELDEPVAVEAREVEELRNKADRFEEMSENLEALRERTDILDDVDRSQVEELAESEDAVVVESARYEELTSEAEQVAGVYAAQLAEEYPAFSAEELTDKFSIEELREKYEEQIGDVEDLASSSEAEPRSQDADEESLEDAADEADESDSEELSDKAAEKQAEMKRKILEGR